MQHDVFISFKSEDQRFAEKICDELNKRNITCWISSRNIRSGSTYQSAITDAVLDASVLVLVFSSAANQSEEIIKELTIASKYKKLVIPVRIEDFLPERGPFVYELTSREYIDLFKNWEREIDHLSEDIKFYIAEKGEKNRASNDDMVPQVESKLEDPKAELPLKSETEIETVVGWPEVGYGFLDAVYKNVDIALLPFTIPLEDFLQGEDLTEAIHEDEWIYWQVNSKSYFAVWFDTKNKPKNKIDVLWGFYSENEKRDPVFRKICDEIYDIKELLDDDSEVTINGYTYEFVNSNLGFQTVEHMNFSELGDRVFCKQIAEQIILLSNKIWPVVQKNYGMENV